MTSAQKRSANFMVVMEGIPIGSSLDGRISGISSKQEKTATRVVEANPPTLQKVSEEATTDLHIVPKTKPAILTKTGTVGTVPVMERPKPVEKTSTLRQQTTVTPVSLPLSRVPNRSRINTMDYTSRSETVSQIDSDGGNLFSEAYEISRQVDETVQRHQAIGPHIPGRSKGKRSQRSVIAGKASNKANNTVLSSTILSANSVASLYETDQTRLVDTLISRLKQQATGELVTDTDFKIREVTKQIAESLGIPPEELDPELFSDQGTTPRYSASLYLATPGEMEGENRVVSAIPEEGEASFIAASAGENVPEAETAGLRLDAELSAIIKSMSDHEKTPSKVSAYGVPSSREAFGSDDDLLDDIDDLEELGQLASLPEVVTTADVLFIAGRQFKLGNLAQLDKDDDGDEKAKAVETKGRLEKILEQHQAHHVEDGRVHVHALCFSDQKSEGLLPNELAQVAFQSHVQSKFTRRRAEVQDERPLWYQTALQEVRSTVSGGGGQTTQESRSDFNFGAMRNVPFVNVDDALFVPGMEERPPSGLKPLGWMPTSTDIDEGVEGVNVPILQHGDPNYPTFSAGPPLLGMTPQQVRKKLFPQFESSADTRVDDYRLVKLDERFVMKEQTLLEESFFESTRSATSILKRLVSKDDLNLMARFRHRLPSRSALPHRLTKAEQSVIEIRKPPPANDGIILALQANTRPGRSPTVFRERHRGKRSSSDTRLLVVITLLGNSEPTVRIKQDYKSAMVEVELHRTLCQQRIVERKATQEREAAEKAAAELAAAMRAELSPEPDAYSYDEEEGEVDFDVNKITDADFNDTLLSQIEFVESKRKVMTPSAAELALWSERPGHLRKLAKPLRRRKLDSDKMEWVKSRLAVAPRITRRTRRQSAPPNMKVEYKKHHATFGPRSSSPGAVLDFDDYARQNGMKATDVPREWVRAIWDVWFDEVIPPLEAFGPLAVSKAPPVDASAALAESLATLMNTEKKAAEVKEEVVEAVQTLEIFDLDIPPVTGSADDELEQEKVAILFEEVDRMTALLAQPLRLLTKAIALCRRGAILRKLGKLVSALSDLNSAIALFPNFVDALWHRHFILLVENKTKDAITDLNLIVRIFRLHPGAYMSRAAIFTAQDDILEAIDDYTMAIRAQPNNPEAYFLRAKLYERKGEPLLAMEDYMRANQLMPHDTTALFCHAQHYIRTGNNLVAVQDLTQILERDPSNADMYLLRGQCLSKLNRFEAACSDFSAAIYLNPNSSEAFFQRGSLLRKLYPERALADFSISLLIDSSHGNIRSLLNRGFVYLEMGLDEMAEADFERVLNIDRDHPGAHTNLGRIYLNKRQDYPRAVRRFTTAIRADPTYRQAYLCRAEAHSKLKHFNDALKDFTKAIHLDPGDYSVYVHRGAVALANGNYNLASFCIRQATEVQKEVGQGVYQKAFVQAFLKRFDKAIDILQSSLRSHVSSAQAYIVLGKIYMKARDFGQAAKCFAHALDTMAYGEPDPVKKLLEPEAKPDPRPKREVIAAKWPDEAPELYFLLGRCFLYQHKWTEALEAITDAIKLKPEFPEALYCRGVIRFALKHQRAIEDIHRALALDPKIFEAYLTRAVFFAQKKLWPLAIVNCNEAIKLQPRCIRSYVYRGAFKYFNHNYKGAIEDLSEATRIDRGCVIALFNRACAYQDADCIKLALRDYSTLLLVESQRQTNRLTQQTYVNRGLLYFNRRDYANALADFRHAAELKPHDAALVHALALCYHKQNLLKKSVITYSKVLTTHPSFDDGYIGRANALVDYNTTPARTYAMREYMRLLRIKPTLHAARINLAICLQMTGRLHQAYRQLTIVITMLERESAAPLSTARARELRGVVSLQAKSYNASFQDLSIAARTRPSAAILNNRAVCNLMMNCREAAVKDFREALHLDQRFSIGYFNLANMFIMNKRWEQAKDFFERAILFGPNNETAMINRAVSLARLGDLSSAFHDLKAAMPISPHAHHIAYNLAVLHRMVKKLPDALADIDRAIRMKPDDPALYSFRALVRADLGDTDGSMEDHTYAVDLANYLNEHSDKMDTNNQTALVPV